MIRTPSLIERNLKHVWHPCSQMKDYATFKPLEIVGAQGSYLHARNGQKLIDAFSSWWCKLLGHGHPRLQTALIQQAMQFEHCALVQATHAPIVELSEKLAALTTSLTKILYAGDGSSAIEMALKLCLHARYVQGDRQRQHFIALQHAYHGETLGALSVSDLGLYRTAYEPLLFRASFLAPLPYVSGEHDPAWAQEAPAAWEQCLAQLEPMADQVTAMIVEPIVQGAGGMRIYSPLLLRKIREWTSQHGIYLIADEIMTGIGRTGKLLACEHAGIEPDLLCLGKGLTAGWLPFSAVLTCQALYDLCYDDYETGKAFLHSHTYAGNPLAASIATTVMEIVQEEGIADRANLLGEKMRGYFLSIAQRTGRLKHIRALGGIVAAELIEEAPSRRLGFAIYQKALALGAFLRPLGNTLYWLPPLTIEDETLEQLAYITEQAILAVS